MKEKKRFFTAMAAIIACVGVIGFTACVESPIVLTENTDFDALISEKVNEDGWKNAFSISSCTNCTVLLREKEYSNYLSIVNKNNNKTIEHSVYELASNSVILKEYYDKVGDEIFWYSDTEMSTGESLDHFAKYPINEKGWYDDVDNWLMTYEFVCPNFGQLFERFTYNDQTGAYEFKGRDYCNNRDELQPNYNPNCDGGSDCPHAEFVETNSICERWIAKYYQASVKIVNGKLACVETTMSGNPKCCIYFYGYGTTTVTLPACQFQ